MSDPVKDIIKRIVDWAPTERGARFHFKDSLVVFDYTVTELRVIIGELVDAVNVSKGRDRDTVPPGKVKPKDIILIGLAEHEVTNTLLESRNNDSGSAVVIEVVRKSTQESVELTFLDPDATVEVWRTIE